MTHYDILGISKTAIDSEIKKAYHQMIIAFHPDKYQGDKKFAAKKTHEIIEAYKVLSHPATRKRYDDSLNSKGQKSAPSYSQKPKPKGLSKYKVALLMVGALFVIFVVTLFIIIMISL